jgi:hypothetical protein
MQEFQAHAYVITRGRSQKKDQSSDGGAGIGNHATCAQPGYPAGNVLGTSPPKGGISIQGKRFTPSWKTRHRFSPQEAGHFCRW